MSALYQLISKSLYLRGVRALLRFFLLRAMDSRFKDPLEDYDMDDFLRETSVPSKPSTSFELANRRAS